MLGTILLETAPSLCRWVEWRRTLSYSSPPLSPRLATSTTRTTSTLQLQPPLNTRELWPDWLGVVIWLEGIHAGFVSGQHHSFCIQCPLRVNTASIGHHSHFIYTAYCNRHLQPDTIWSDWVSAVLAQFSVRAPHLLSAPLFMFLLFPSCHCQSKYHCECRGCGWLQREQCQETHLWATRGCAGCPPRNSRCLQEEGVYLQYKQLLNCCEQCLLDLTVLLFFLNWFCTTVHLVMKVIRNAELIVKSILFGHSSSTISHFFNQCSISPITGFVSLMKIKKCCIDWWSDLLVCLVVQREHFLQSSIMFLPHRRLEPQLSCGECLVKVNSSTLHLPRTLNRTWSWMLQPIYQDRASIPRSFWVGGPRAPDWPLRHGSSLETTWYWGRHRPSAFRPRRDLKASEMASTATTLFSFQLNQF